MYQIQLHEITERPGKKATVRRCFLMEVEEISVLDLDAAIEKIRAKRARNGDGAGSGAGDTQGVQQ